MAAPVSVVLERIRHMTGARPIDPTERAHLLDEAGYTPPIHRYAPSPALADVVRRYWMPIWSFPAGQTSVQRVLQYPVCLTVISDSYALLVGPSTGLSTTELAGSGWALGTMYQPAAGRALVGGPVEQLTDAAVPLADADLVRRVRKAIGDDPDDPARRQAAVAATEEALAAQLPVDDEGRLVNAIVEYVEGDTGVQRVGQVCDEFAITERTLQRLTARRIGLSPMGLIQRRRLHEAADRLADQAHFGRDFRTVTGLTPGEFAAEPRG
jgi:AraC-like DNA-binding protein